MPLNLTSIKVSPMFSLVSEFITITFLQSLPPSLICMASMLPSFVKLTSESELVPSFEKVFGSKKTKASSLFFCL